MLPLDPVDPTSICIALDESLRAAVLAIDRNQRGIALVVDLERRLVGTITDGDVRRAMLANRGLDTPLRELLAERVTSPYPQPVTASVGTDPQVLLQLMHEHVIRQIPLVDDDGRPVDVVTIEGLRPDDALGVHAVIMAGGFGSRLMPLTEDTPKPMLPVGDKPLMEILIDQLRRSGIRNVSVTTHYRGDKIKSYFGDGHLHGVALTYVNEDQPMGTAGALGLLAASAEPLLVINGDILTAVDFRALLHFHREHKAEMTIAVRKYEVEVPYGVIECHDAQVVNLTEKPHLSLFVNAGIYLLEPSVCALITGGETLHMTDLIRRMLDARRSVVSFPVREYWLDIGRHSDYELAQAYIKSRAVS